MFWRKKGLNASGQHKRDTFKMMRTLEAIQFDLKSLCRTVAKYEIGDAIEYQVHNEYGDGFGLRIGVVSNIGTLSGQIKYLVHSSKDPIYEKHITRKIKTKKKDK